MHKGLILLILMILTVACGQVDRIDLDVEVNRLGDGEHYTQNVVVPLSEKQIASFTSPVGGFDPLIRGMMGTIMGLGASIGAGKTRLTLVQPIPEIPDKYLASVKIKRIFFYMDAEPVVDPSLFNVFQKKKQANFDFLRRLAVKMSATKMEESDHAKWEPLVNPGDISDEEMGFFRGLFRKKDGPSAQKKWEEGTSGLLMIKYHQDDPAEALQGNSVGKMFVIETATPAATRKYIEQEYKEHVVRVHTLNTSILVELKKTASASELFKRKISNDSYKIDELGIGEINPCTQQYCLDLKVPDVNLVPMLKKGNGIKIDAYIDPKDVPKSFQLKGFLEFEIKIKTRL